jgi:hypothetical protein
MIEIRLELSDSLNPPERKVKRLPAVWNLFIDRDFTYAEFVDSHDLLVAHFLASRYVTSYVMGRNGLAN